MTAGGTERWCRMRWSAPCGAVSKGLAGVQGEEVVGPPLLELPLGHEHGGAGVGAQEGPLQPVADHTVSREYLRDPLGEGAREQLHVPLTGGHEPVVVQFGGAQDLGADSNVRIPRVGRWRCATEDGLVGVDDEPPDEWREALDEAGLYVVGASGLSIGLVQHGL